TLEGINFNEVLDFLAHDKKIRDRKLRFALPTTLGKADLFDSVPREAIRQALSNLHHSRWMSN
ncbi:MAG: hypothetical protein D6814_15090, partial [Calditrichaeota bacterium]